MLSLEDSSQIAAELDAAHQRARACYIQRDAAGVMEQFSPDLSYRRLDGQTINYKTLARDVHVQLARMSRATTEYSRESLEIGPGGLTATEMVEQRATYEVRMFGVLHREWRIRRRGRYEWVRADAGWQIVQVEVVAEVVDGTRVWLGVR